MLWASATRGRCGVPRRRGFVPTGDVTGEKGPTWLEAGAMGSETVSRSSALMVLLSALVER